MMEASIRSILRCLLVLQRMLLLQTIRRTTHAGGLAPPTGELVLVMRGCRIVIKSGRVISRIRITFYLGLGWFDIYHNIYGVFCILVYY